MRKLKLIYWMNGWMNVQMNGYHGTCQNYLCQRAWLRTQLPGTSPLLCPVSATLSVPPDIGTELLSTQSLPRARHGVHLRLGIYVTPLKGLSGWDENSSKHHQNHKNNNITNSLTCPFHQRSSFGDPRSVYGTLANVLLAWAPCTKWPEAVHTPLAGADSCP